MTPDLLAEWSSLWGEGKCDGGDFAGEVEVEPICSGGEDGVGRWGDFLPLACIGIVFLVLYPKTCESGGGGGYCYSANGGNVFSKADHCTKSKVPF